MRLFTAEPRHVLTYVALDRPDLSFASRVASSKMSDPQEGDEQIIKRIIRYLKGKPRVAIRYQFSGRIRRDSGVY